MKIDGQHIVMGDGTRYVKPYGVLSLTPPPGLGVDDPIPLRHRVEIAEYMMRAWDEYRSRLSDEIIERNGCRDPFDPAP